MHRTDNKKKATRGSYHIFTSVNKAIYVIEEVIYPKRLKIKTGKDISIC